MSSKSGPPSIGVLQIRSSYYRCPPEQALLCSPSRQLSVPLTVSLLQWRWYSTVSVFSAPLLKHNWLSTLLESNSIHLEYPVISGNIQWVVVNCIPSIWRSVSRLPSNCHIKSCVGKVHSPVPISCPIHLSGGHQLICTYKHTSIHINTLSFQDILY